MSVNNIIERGAIISGIGISRISRKSGIGGIDLTAESSAQAIQDAGLTPGDIDGIATMGETPIPEAAVRLGIDPAWTGGAMGRWGLLTPVVNAFHAVSSGQARHVLVYRTVNMMGGSVFPSPQEGGAPVRTAAAPVQESDNPMGGIPRLLAAHAYSAANWLALHARRHMDLYGTTKEQLGWLAINSRKTAALNPRAAYRAPITMDDYMSARMISEPFGLLDCDVPVDGSVACIESSADAAQDCDQPDRVEACGGTPGLGGWDQRPDYPKMAATDAAAELWSRTSLTSGDVDFAGCPMHAGDRVLMNFPAANRDPAAFDRPDQVLLDRQLNRHVAFGSGIHRCAGSNLARMELRVALEEWLARIPEFELAPGAEVTWAGGQVRGPRQLPVVF